MNEGVKVSLYLVFAGSLGLLFEYKYVPSVVLIVGGLVGVLLYNLED